MENVMSQNGPDQDPWGKPGQSSGPKQSDNHQISKMKMAGDRETIKIRSNHRQILKRYSITC